MVIELCCWPISNFMPGSQGSGICPKAGTKPSTDSRPVTLTTKDFLWLPNWVYTWWVVWLRSFLNEPHKGSNKWGFKWKVSKVDTMTSQQSTNNSRESRFSLFLRSNPQCLAEALASPTSGSWTSSWPRHVTQASSHPPWALPLKACRLLGLSPYCSIPTSLLPVYLCHALLTSIQKIEGKNFFFFFLVFT